MTGMKRNGVGTVMILTAAAAFWAGRKTAPIVGLYFGTVRNDVDPEAEADDEEEDRRLAVEMFDAVHDMLRGDLETALTAEGLRP